MNWLKLLPVIAKPVAAILIAGGLAWLSYGAGKDACAKVRLRAERAAAQDAREKREQADELSTERATQRERAAHDLEQRIQELRSRPDDGCLDKRL